MDSVLLKTRIIGDGPVYLAVVCDGVGSMADGAFAASTAVEMLSEWFDVVQDVRRVGLQLLDRVREISNSISILAQARGLQTASTLSALLIAEGRYYIVHTGDSRIYACRDEKLIQLTQDQVLGGKLTACLGRADRTNLLYGEGDDDMRAYLLCSDGIYKTMDPAYLEQALLSAERRNLRRTMDDLVQYAVARGETDNISIAVMIKER